MLEELNSLNPPQRKAVQTTEGRLLILAGAGCGKTRVLTLRMAYLIKIGKISPRAILGLTFTNKAAAEMRHRLAQFVSPKEAKEVTLCTFHSFCCHVLRHEIEHLGYTKNFTLYDEQDVKRLILLIVRDHLEHEGDLPSLAATIEQIKQAQNKGESIKLQSEEASWHDQFIVELHQRLQASMRAYNAVDFDGLLKLVVDLFTQFPAVLNSYQEKFRYIMVDEFQDTNRVQNQIVELLAANQNLCVVGDEDQSIYGWRGAEVNNILNFKEAALIKLEQNYRSTSLILRAANSVIQHNVERHTKVLWSAQEEGLPIEVFYAPNEIDEVEAVIKRILNLREKHHLQWKDIAILYRSNSIARHFELGLMKQVWLKEGKWIQGVPYKVFGGTEFYERKEIKDLCAYLRLIINPYDQEACLRIINQPRRGIGEDTLDTLTAYNRLHQMPLWNVLQEAIENKQKFNLPTKAMQGLEKFLCTMQEATKRFATDSLADTLHWLITTIDYDKAIKQEVKSQQMRDFKNENVKEFVEALREFEQEMQEKQQAASLAEFVTSLSLDNPMKARQKHHKEQDFIHVMTFHSAKGLEFPACFLVGLEDHIIPHEKSMLLTGVEEERRLMYVAITRAQRYLICSMAQKRKRLGKEKASRPSRFLFEIPKEYLRITDWKM